MLDVSNLLAAGLSEGTMEDEKLAVAANDTAPLEGRVAFGLAVQSPRDLHDLALPSRCGRITYRNSTAAGNAAHIKQLWRSH